MTIFHSRQQYFIFLFLPPPPPQFAEQFVNSCYQLDPIQTYTPFFRLYIAYKLMISGRDTTDTNRLYCDIHCRIYELDGSNVDEILWSQCVGPSCSTWAHNYCAELDKKWQGDYQCHTCKTSD